MTTPDVVKEMAAKLAERLQYTEDTLGYKFILKALNAAYQQGKADALLEELEAAQ